MDIRELSVPVMNDPTPKALASLLLNPSALQRFSKELDDIAPLAYEGVDRDEKERATASMYQDKTTALPFTPWTSRDFWMTMEWGVVMREERAPQTMARVLRSVPSRKILMKKPVVARERWM